MEHIVSKEQYMKDYKRKNEDSLNANLEAVNAIIKDKNSRNDVSKFRFTPQELGIIMKVIVKRMEDFKNGIYG